MSGPGCSRTPTRSCSCATTSSPPGTLPTLRTQKPHVIVAIDAEDLTDSTATGPGAGKTGFGARISAARTRWLACDGTHLPDRDGPRRAAPGRRPHPTGRARRTSGGPWSGGTGTACSPAAPPPRTGATSITVHWIDGGETSLGQLRAACANGTTPRSITGSGSNEIPAADGTPTAPTAPRSSSDHRCSCPRSSSGRRRQWRLPGRAKRHRSAL